MGKKVGKLIKEARTNADLTQEQLARKVAGVSANDISLAERGEKDLTQTQLKAIAKATKVTQASLINAAKEEGGSSTKKTASKTTAKKTTSTAKKTTTTTKKTTTTAKKAKTPSNANTTMKVTSTEKKLIEAYRLADSDAKKRAMSVLKGETSDIADVVEDVLGDVLGGILGNK